MKSKGATERLTKLIYTHKVEFVALQEPFMDNNQLDDFKLILGMDHASYNVNDKIWIFCKDAFDCEVFIIQQETTTYFEML